MPMRITCAFMNSKELTLAATIELLLANFVSEQEQAHHGRQQLADACAADWNAVHASVGSFADEHVSL